MNYRRFLVSSEYSVGTFVQPFTYLFLLFLNHQLSSSILTCHFRLCHRYNKTSFCNLPDLRPDLENITHHNFHQMFLILPKVVYNSSLKLTISNPCSDHPNLSSRSIVRSDPLNNISIFNHWFRRRLLIIWWWFLFIY